MLTEMKRIMRTQTTVGELLALAHALKSEDGSNKEYDRGLVELITDAAKLPMEAKYEIAEYLGIEVD